MIIYILVRRCLTFNRRSVICIKLFFCQFSCIGCHYNNTVNCQMVNYHAICVGSFCELRVVCYIAFNSRKLLIPTVECVEVFLCSCLKRYKLVSGNFAVLVFLFSQNDITILKCNCIISVRNSNDVSICCIAYNCNDVLIPSAAVIVLCCVLGKRIITLIFGDCTIRKLACLKNNAFLVNEFNCVLIYNLFKLNAVCCNAVNRSELSVPAYEII